MSCILDVNVKYFDKVENFQCVSPTSGSHSGNFGTEFMLMFILMKVLCSKNIYYVLLEIIFNFIFFNLHVLLVHITHIILFILGKVDFLL